MLFKKSNESNIVEIEAIDIKKRTKNKKINLNIDNESNEKSYDILFIFMKDYHYTETIIDFIDPNDDPILFFSDYELDDNFDFKSGSNLYFILIIVGGIVLLLIILTIVLVCIFKKKTNIPQQSFPSKSIIETGLDMINGENNPSEQNPLKDLVKNPISYITQPNENFQGNYANSNQENSNMENFYAPNFTGDNTANGDYQNEGADEMEENEIESRESNNAEDDE